MKKKTKTRKTGKTGNAKKQIKIKKPVKQQLSDLQQSVERFKETTLQNKWKKHKFEEVLQLERNDSGDFYTFLGKKKINDKIQAVIKRKIKDKKTGKLKLKYKGKVPVVRVKITSKKYKIVTPEFKIQDVQKTYFIAGKRKGKKYTNKDMVAYYVHASLDNENIRLYAKETDGMRKRKLKVNRKAKYAKKQTVEIGIRFVSKRASSDFRAVDDRYKRNK